MVSVGLLKRLVWGAYVAGALFVSGVLIHTLDRGLDLWDEGFNLAYVDAPHRFFFRFSFFDFIVDRTFFWMDRTVVNYRRVSVLLAAASALVFTHGFWRWLRTRLGFPGEWLSGAFVAGLCLLANLLYFAHFPRSVQYNNLNAFLVVSASGLLFTLLSFRDRRPHRDYAILAGGAGLLIACIFFVKFTSLPPFGLLAALAIATLLDSVPFRMRLVVLAYFAGGFCLGVAFFFTAVVPLSAWWSGFSYSIALELQNAHEGSKLVLIYWKDIVRYTSNFIPVVPVVLLWLGSALYFGPRKRPLRATRFAWAISLVGTTYLLLRLHQTAFITLRLPEPFLFIPITLLPSVVALVSLAGGWREHRHVLGVGLFLLLMPFAGSFGTANGIVFGTLPYLIGMAALTLVLGLVLERAVGREGLSLVGVVLFFALAMHATYSRLVHFPRGISPIAQQTERVAGLPRLEGLYVSRPLNEYLTAVKEVLERETLFQPGDPMMFVYDHPSVVYALGGTSPGMPWYFFHRNALNCAVFSGAVERGEFDRSRLLILTQEGPRRRLKRCLSAHGINFPEGFKEVASIEYGSGGTGEKGPASQRTKGRRRRLRLADDATRIFVPPSMLRRPESPLSPR